MSDLFFYKRIEKRKEKDEAGKEIEVERTYWDCFNVSKVVRGMWMSEGVFSLLLDDGHEQAQDQRVPILSKDGKTAKGYEVKRVRDWYYTQVNLFPDDAERFRKAHDPELWMEELEKENKVDIGVD